MGIVAWENFFIVHIKEIDEQHHKIVDFTNEIYDKLNSATTVDLSAFDDIFDQLREHADLHFGTEERYFAKFQYPEANVHIAEHNKIKDRIMDLKTRFLAARNQDIIFEALKLLDDWLLVHIMEYDQKYVKLFHEHGLK